MEDAITIDRVSATGSILELSKAIPDLSSATSENSWHSGRHLFCLVLLSRLDQISSPLATGETQAPRRNISKTSKRFCLSLDHLFRHRHTRDLGPSSLRMIQIYCKLSAMVPKMLVLAQSLWVSSELVSRALIMLSNAVTLTSASSSANSFLYAGSRNLYSLTLTGQAPEILRTCSKNGVPYLALLCGAALSCLTYLSTSQRVGYSLRMVR